MLRKVSSIIVYSVISAAFIGPGTVTTALRAGANYQFALLWAALFSVAACLALQELIARITIVGKLDMGDALLRSFGKSMGRTIGIVLGGSVIFGCAAYEAGNIVGAASGLALLWQVNFKLLVAGIAIIAAVILSLGGRKQFSFVLMLMVAGMSVSFFIIAIVSKPNIDNLLIGLFTPSLPHHAELLVIGLIGTTIVPYNLFLGSKISRDQTLPDMRFGLTVSVLTGGLITLAIVVAGATLSSFDSFEAVYDALRNAFGAWAGYALAFGLFAAGLSSAITAPFASATIAQTVFNIQDKRWITLFWMGVLLVGTGVGISGFKPIPVILLAQALNGLILPLLTVFMIRIANNTHVIPKHMQPSIFYNIILLLILFIVLIIGLNNVHQVLETLVGSITFYWVWIVSAVVTVVTGYMIFRKS